MGIPDIFTIVGSALEAQNSRMGAIASNLANVDSVSTPGTEPYRAREVVFSAQQNMIAGDDDQDSSSNLGVGVTGTVLSNAPLKSTYDPGSPNSDSNGYVTGSNVSQVGQMVDLIDSSNSYAASVAVLQQTTRIDQQILSSFQVS